MTLEEDHDLSYSLFLNKLEESGLNEKDAKLLDIRYCTPDETASHDPSFSKACSMKIMYPHPMGGYLSDILGGEDFFRIRYLEAPQDLEEDKKKEFLKKKKYVQRPKTNPVAYYPSNINWRKCLEDINKPIIITEGELKAASACKIGYHTVGIGGVWNWRALKRGIEWIPSLNLIIFKRRKVIICFDSDMKTNTHVVSAARELSQELTNRGAFVHYAVLPDNAGKKVGLDDFIVFAGPHATDAMDVLIQNAMPTGLSEMLFALNDRYTYIRNPGLILDKRDDSRVSVSTFSTHRESNKLFNKRYIKKDGTAGFRQINGATAWLSWPLRSECTKLVYEPGLPRIVEQNDGFESYNIWQGWGCEPKKGDLSLFEYYIENLTRGMRPEELHWFLSWLAYPLIYPGQKLMTSVLIHSATQGNGKTLIGQTMKAIYGKNAIIIGLEHLLSDFNRNWAEARQFVIGDEIVTQGCSRVEWSKIKRLITQEEIHVNEKLMPSFTIRDVTNYYFTSQYADAFQLEPGDRRFFIHNARRAKRLPEDFPPKYMNWLLNEGGAQAVFDYLLHYPIGDFGPYSAALMTDAKMIMIGISKSEISEFVTDFLANPEYYISRNGYNPERDLFTTKEIAAIFDPKGLKKKSTVQIGKELSQAGCTYIHGGNPIRLKDGSFCRYFAVKNQETWSEFGTLQSAQEHLNKFLSKKS